ncbi:MAG: hypothetical protein MUO54_15155 [Anaerolineales bacterium]|nr:hypothetical protein [Anaerolineales bacterium]
MTKQTSNNSEDNLILYQKLVATNPDVKRKGKTNSYTSLNGHMFSISKEGKLALRLPKVEREQFLVEHNTEICVQYGRVMKEYVIVPDELLQQTNLLKKHFTLSYDYIGLLKPKPTKK